MYTNFNKKIRKKSTYAKTYGLGILLYFKTNVVFGYILMGVIGILYCMQDKFCL